MTKKRNIPLLLLGILATASLMVRGADQNPGVVASLDIATVESAKDAYFAYILKLLNGVHIPNISFDKGHINGNMFSV